MTLDSSRSLLGCGSGTGTSGIATGCAADTGSDATTFGMASWGVGKSGWVSCAIDRSGADNGIGCSLAWIIPLGLVVDVPSVSEKPYTSNTCTAAERTIAA